LTATILMKRLPNIAMHLSRHQNDFSVSPSSLRPGDGERYPYPAYT
jgi:hypothetical protein